MEKTTLAQVNEIIKALDFIEPIFQFEQPKREESFQVNEALARAFNDVPFRTHLKNYINKQIYKAAMNCESEKEMWLAKGRITVLKELYRDMERAFNTYLAKKK
jgi:Leu/Phe-tRNA-protein transferase